MEIPCHYTIIIKTLYSTTSYIDNLSQKKKNLLYRLMLRIKFEHDMRISKFRHLMTQYIILIMNEYIYKFIFVSSYNLNNNATLSFNCMKTLLEIFIITKATHHVLKFAQYFRKRSCSEIINKLLKVSRRRSSLINSTLRHNCLERHCICFETIIIKKQHINFGLNLISCPNQIITSFNPQSISPLITNIALVMELINHIRPAQKRHRVTQSLQYRVPSTVRHETRNTRMRQYSFLRCPLNYFSNNQCPLQEPIRVLDP